MDDAVVETLKIEVVGDTGDAIKGLDKLLGTLDKLNGITGKGGKGTGNVQKKLDGIAAAVNNLDSAGIAKLRDLASSIRSLNGVKLSATLAQRILDMGAAVESLRDLDTTKLSAIAACLRTMNGVGRSGGHSQGRAAAPLSSVDSANTVSADLSETAKFSESVSERVEETVSTLTGFSKWGERFGAVFAGAGAKVSTAFDKVGQIAPKVLSKCRVAAEKATKGVAGFYENLALGPFAKVISGLSGITSKLKDLLVIVKKRVLYRAVNAAISAITNGVKAGTANAYQFSKALNGTLAASFDRIATSSLYFKNSVGAAAAPLINALAPALDYVTDKCVAFLNVVNQLIARLTGADTWMRAVRYPTEYAEAANTATAANKELKKSILGLDEINALQGSNVASGAGSSTGLDYSKMFEEVPTAEGKNPFSRFFKPFADAWSAEGLSTIKAVKNALSGIKKLCSTVGDSFRRIWENDAGVQTVKNLLNIVQSLARCVTSICDGLSRAWSENQNGERILQNMLDLVNRILEFVGRLYGSTADWLGGLNFAPLLNSVANCLDALDPLVSLINDSLLWAYENVLQPIGSWVIEEAAPASVDLLSEAFRLLTEALTPVVDGFKDAKAEIQPVIDWLEDKVVNTIDNVRERFEKLSDSISERSESLQKIIHFGVSFLATALDLATLVLDQCRDRIWNILNLVLDRVQHSFEALIDLGAAVIDFFSGVFTGDWSRAWDAIQNIFKTSWEGVKNWFKDTVNFLLRTVQNLVNGVIRGGNFAIKLLQKIGVDVQPFSLWTAPQLADGGVVNAGTMFIAGEAGAEVVANMGSRTGVMNTDEMRESVAQGVCDANAEQNALLREEISLLRQLLAKDPVVRAVVGTGDIVSGLERKNRRDGRTVIPVGV